MYTFIKHWQSTGLATAEYTFILHIQYIDCFQVPVTCETVMRLPLLYKLLQL